VECKWEGKPVQKSLTYLPSDSLNAVELTGTFGEQAQRFIGRYTEDIARATEDIADSKRSVSERVSNPDVRFHRARIERLEARVSQLKRASGFLKRSGRPARRPIRAIDFDNCSLHDLLHDSDHRPSQSKKEVFNKAKQERGQVTELSGREGGFEASVEVSTGITV
jgi:hypothetical protein